MPVIHVCLYIFTECVSCLLWNSFNPTPVLTVALVWLKWMKNCPLPTTHYFHTFLHRWLPSKTCNEERAIKSVNKKCENQTAEVTSWGGGEEREYLLFWQGKATSRLHRLTQKTDARKTLTNGLRQGDDHCWVNILFVCCLTMKSSRHKGKSGPSSSGT